MASRATQLEQLAQAPISPVHWALRASQGTPTPFYAYDWTRLFNRKLTGLAQARIDFMERGETSRKRFLIVEVPVRSGKSLLGSVYTPSWWLGTFPNDRVIITSKNNELATTFSRQARDLLTEHGPEVFGVSVSKASAAADRWDLAAPNRGGLIAVGVGQPPTGQGAHCLIIDDPVPGDEEAFSPTAREKIWRWFRWSIANRLEPGGVMVIIMSRWHEQDLSGRLQLLQAEYQAGVEKNGGDDDEMEGLDSGWEVLHLPALADHDPSKGETDPLGREVGAALVPERYSRRALLAFRDSPTGVGALAFQALFQNRPTSEEGELFKYANWQYLTAPPAGLQMIRWWDLAATAVKVSNSDPDWTAGALLGRDSDGYTYVLDVARIRAEPIDVQRFIRNTAISDFQRFGNRTQGMSQDPGQAGKVLADHYQRMVLPEFETVIQSESGDKVTRAMPLAGQQGSRNVFLVAPEEGGAKWIEPFKAELAAAPRGAHDDQLDSAAMAYRYLAGLGRTQVRLIA